MSLTDSQIERYNRHLILEPVGAAGQEKLLASKVLIVGLGGLGSPAALYLAAAGVGTLGLLDGDDVEASNLQRQIIHHTSDVARRKTVSAREKIQAVNPDVVVRTHDEWARADNLGQIVSGYDFVIDAVDNFAGKFLINDACYFAQVPFVHGGILEFDGQLMTVIPGQSACYRCVFPAPPATDSASCHGPAGVFGVLPGVIGALQATEAIKYLLGIGDLLTDTLLTYQALTMRFRKVPVGRQSDCGLCGPHPQITELHDVEPVSPAGGPDAAPNVTTCGRAGSCPRERFDVTPYARAVSEYLRQAGRSQCLPRTYTVAFSGCPSDCALAAVADLGFFAELRDGVRGFSVRVGGEGGSQPSLGVQIEESASEDEVLAIVEAVTQLLREHDDGDDRCDARLRRVITRLGTSEFERCYRTRRTEIRAAGGAMRMLDFGSDTDAAQ